MKKKVTDGTTITTTEYMTGFQYTNNVLDFFPHAEGYVKTIPSSIGGGGGGTTYSFKYVFTYTDHLGNIRLKYAQDPSKNNEISILEEDHYYPYGLKHSGYNTFHQIFSFGDGEGPGTGIVLTPVNPFLGDSYKYKFGGKEYQTEFDINTYDFGARNYDPALGRWMNIDPLAEMMRRHSPYHYAYNNPIYYIDPDGMMGIPMAVTSLGMGISGVSDIGGGGDFSQQRPDPQYPNTSGVQELDAVNLGTIKKKEPNKGVDGGLHEWGIGYQDRGEKDGTVQASVDIKDFPMSTSGGVRTNRFMQLIEDFLDMLNWYNDVPEGNKKSKANESTMENRNEEPVEPPKNNIVYTVEGPLKPNSRYGANSPDYGGTGESFTTKDYNKSKRDSLRFAKTGLFEKLSIRRDTIK